MERFRVRIFLNDRYTIDQHRIHMSKIIVPSIRGLISGWVTDHKRNIRAEYVIRRSSILCE